MSHPFKYLSHVQVTGHGDLISGSIIGYSDNLYSDRQYLVTVAGEKEVRRALVDTLFLQEAPASIDYQIPFIEIDELTDLVVGDIVDITFAEAPYARGVVTALSIRYNSAIAAEVILREHTNEQGGIIRVEVSPSFLKKVEPEAPIADSTDGAENTTKEDRYSAADLSPSEKGGPSRFLTDKHAMRR